MRSPTQTAFFAVFLNELLLNSKRIAPYALMIFFSSNAVLWSVAGAAVHYGWATNSDFCSWIVPLVAVKSRAV